MIKPNLVEVNYGREFIMARPDRAVRFISVRVIRVLSVNRVILF
jgi:hypothetical protein